jgi:hypothetical protein
MLDHTEKKEIEHTRMLEISRYTRMVKVEPRREPLILANKFQKFKTTAFPVLTDPDRRLEKSPYGQDPDELRRQTEERARAYTGVAATNCGRYSSRCYREHNPIQMYGGNFEHVDKDMVRALLLTSEWMNARGIHGYWGHREFGGFSTKPCDSPVIYYNAWALPLTKCEQLQDTENNILFTFKRLSEMLEKHPQLEDAIANMFYDTPYIDRFKRDTGETNYWKYSQDPKFPQGVRDFVGGFLVLYDWQKRQKR